MKKYLLPFVLSLALVAPGFAQVNAARKTPSVNLDRAAVSAVSSAEGPGEQAKAAAEQARQLEDLAREARENAQAAAAPAPAVAQPAPKARPASPNGGGPVVVTATAGTVGPTSYATLKLAFDAINAGTHQGAITIGISSSTTEGATPATLNSGDAAPASYTSVLIQPIVDGVSVSGNPASGFGVIQLNGADNVTIDGDNPNTSGTNRNLTVSNTATAATTYGSAIRIATSAAVTSADNNIIRNCILSGNVTGGNLSTITGTTTSSNASFGIYAGGNGGATATGAPTAITSVTTNTAPSGTTINNLLVSNNSINQCARAVAFNGAATTVSNGVTVTNNVIGDQGTPSPSIPPYTSPSSTVYTKGIWLNGANAVTVTGNTLKNIMSYVATPITTVELAGAIGTSVTINNNTITNPTQNGGTSAVKAILVSSASGTYSISGNIISNVQALSSSSGTDAIDAGGTATSGTIELNKVSYIRNLNAGTWGCYGISVAAGTNITVKNNFVSDLSMNMTGGGAFSTTFGIHGIRIAGGTGHKIYHNSVYMFGALTGTATTSILTSAFTILSTGQTGIDVRNNIFTNLLTGGTTSIAHVSIWLPSAGTSAMNLTDNNNDYFFGTDPTTQGAGQAGTTAGTNFYTTLGALAAYSSTLSSAATNDNASKAVDPQFLSTTDLHIQVASPMVDMGVNVGVNTDIDGQTRVPPPDIGADEPSGITAPANDIACTAIVTPIPTGSYPLGAVLSPQATFQNVGTATQTSIGVQFTITGPGGYSYTNNQVIASLASGASTTVTFAAAPAFTPAGTYSMAALLTTPDSNSANDVQTSSFLVLTPLSGSYNVPGDYPSLTNAGGIFAALNGAGASGNITINITGNLTAETGANALNQIAGGFSVLIKPSLLPIAGGAPASARTISGTSTGSALIKFNGADNVTIDGSDSGGTNHALTITNGNAAATVIWIASASASDGANNVTVQNCDIAGNPGTVAIAGILTGSGTTLGNDAEAPNNNITILSNNIFRVQNSCYIRGTTAGSDTGCSVIGNVFGSTVAADKNIFRGMLIANETGFLISQNTISGVASTATSTAKMTGIQTALVLNGGTIERNKVRDIKQLNPGTYGAAGIDLTGGDSVLVKNNFVSDINHDMSGGISFSTTFGVFGIQIEGGTNTKIYNNSVNLYGPQIGTANSSLLTAAFAINATTSTGCDVRDNIFANNLTGGTTSIAHVAVYLPSAGTAAMLLTENKNAYYNGADAASGVGQAGTTAGTNFYVTLAALQAYSQTLGNATNDNASLAFTSAVPYLTANDLHITCASPVADAGTPIASVTNDIDGQLRSMTAPDIGADEIAAPVPVSVVSRKVHDFAGPFDIPLPLAGPPFGIECRQGGATNDYLVVFAFPTPVTVSSATLSSGTGSVSSAAGSGTNIITVNLTGVTDQQYITVKLSCVDDGAGNSGDVSVTMGMLVGDTNGNGTVNAGDTTQTRGRSGQTADATNFRSDVNTSGVINSGDQIAVRSRAGNFLP